MAHLWIVSNLIVLILLKTPVQKQVKTKQKQRQLDNMVPNFKQVCSNENAPYLFKQARTFKYEGQTNGKMMEMWSLCVSACICW